MMERHQTTLMGREAHLEETCRDFPVQAHKCGGRAQHLEITGRWTWEEEMPGEGVGKAWKDPECGLGRGRKGMVAMCDPTAPEHHSSAGSVGQESIPAAAAKLSGVKSNSEP